MACIVRSSSQAWSGQTAAGLPPKSRLVNASTWYSGIFMTRRLTQGQLQEQRAGDGIDTIRSDGLEAQEPIEGDGLAHRRQRVEPHPRVADRARLGDERLGHPAAQ